MESIIEEFLKKKIIGVGQVRPAGQQAYRGPYVSRVTRAGRAARGPGYWMTLT